MAEQSRLSGWRRRLVALGLGVKASMVPDKIALSLLDPKGWEFLSPGTSTGKVVTDETALKVSTVWACNKILSESVGMLPLGLFRRDGSGNAVRIEDNQAAEVLTATPNEDMTAQELREALQLNLGLRGNGYSFIERNGRGLLTRLYPIVSANVMPERNDSGVIQYRVLDRGRWEIYPRERIWHLKGFGGNGIVGLSVLSAAREAMGIALSAEEFQGTFFRNGARPSAIATFPGWFKDEQRKIARENIQELLGGLENAHKVHILEGGMKLEDWGMPLEDAQFLELRQFSVPDLCRFYRIPPHMVADLSRATFSNIEQQSLEFVQYTLMPWLTKWESSAARWLLTPAERSQGLFFRFNVEGLLRADSQTRAQFLSTMVQNGLMTRNEARAKENLGRSDEEGMDDFTVQVNLSPIDALAGEQDEPAEPVEEEVTVPAGTEQDALREMFRKSQDLTVKAIEGLARMIAAQRPPEINITMPEQKQPIVNVTSPDVHVDAPTTIAEGAIQIVQNKAPVRRIPVRGVDGLIKHTDEVPIDDDQIANG